MQVLGNSGSLRAGSFNTSFPSCRTNPDLDREPFPAAVVDFRAELHNSAGGVFSCAEYAHGVPGVLKDALDWLVASGELTGKGLEGVLHTTITGTASAIGTATAGATTITKTTQRAKVGGSLFQRADCYPHLKRIEWACPRESWLASAWQSRREGRSMARKVLLSSIFRKILIGAVCLLVTACLHAPVALAQHGGGAHGGGFGGGHFGGGGGHFGGGGTHSGARSGGHASAPRSTPAPTAPRGTTGAGAMLPGSGSVAHGPVALVAPTRFNSSSAAFRPRPVPHPTPQPQPVFFVPVFIGSPFFYGGFNSYWGCDPFWGWGGCYSPFGFGYGGGWGYGGYYGGLYGWGGPGYNGWGGGTSGFGLDNGSNLYSSSNAGDLGTPSETYVSPSYPTDTRARDLVELFFKDGTVYDVTDYWVADGQLHFLTVDTRGEKTVEHVLPFDSLDLQTTVDDNTSRGFKFQLRGESMEQYFRNHPETVPKVDPEKPSNQ